MEKHKHCTANQRPPSLKTDVSPFDYSSGPQLTSKTINEFLKWAAFVPVSDVEVIRKRIAIASGEVNLAEALGKELFTLPVRDISRHGLLLSAIGELKNLQTVSFLIDFIWYKELLVPFNGQPQFHQACSFETDGDEILRAKATEMLSYIGSREAREATLDIAAKHTSDFVRAAAIDAYMFNSGDSTDAAEQLYNIVQKEDIWRIGLPRLTKNMDPELFEKNVFEFYNKYPEMRPKAPHKCVTPGPEPRSWYIDKCKKKEV